MQLQEQVLRDDATHHKQPDVSAAHGLLGRIHKAKAFLSMKPYKVQLLSSVSDMTMFIWMQSHART